MKRRNADCGKLRRPIKRNKITESMYGSTTVLYMKFLVLWAIVITADFMFMFRFEFLWPFWLLLRSVHDSFKYKGLAFSVLFVCIAITSDLVCLFFIPVHWLLFAASTYVWVQYVWHTDKGICLPTIILWMLFVYLEAGIRWKDTRHMPHLDLCRPFAAHCIGYPVVTLGFGFKSYVGYRMRQRRQREVAKENEFYMQLLQQALPHDEPVDEVQISTTALTTTTTTTTTTGTTTQIAQNSAQSTCSTNSIAASATNSISANGNLATQAQNHHYNNPQNDIHKSHQNFNSSSSNHNNVSSSTSLNSGTTAITNTDDKNYVQIAGSSGGSSGGNSNLNSNIHHQNTNSHHNHHNNSHNTNQHYNHQHHHHNQHNNTNSRNFHQNSALNGHIGGNSKNHRRSTDKENKNRANGFVGGDTENKHQKVSNGANENNTINKEKDKLDWDGNSYQISHNQTHNAKEKHDENRVGSNSNTSKKSNMNNSSIASTANVFQYNTDDIIVESAEKSKGRRNRSKKDNSKDNHQSQNHNNNNSQTNNNINHAHSNQQQHNNNNNKETLSSANNINNNNSDASSVSSSASSSCSSTTSTTSEASVISNLASKVVTKICESCLKLEAEVKKYRSEISHMKQIENELRQKLDLNLTTKSCLQAKQKECEDLEKRIHELSNARHADMLQLQTAERRLTEERRHKQSLDSQLSNEKKARKLAEDKAARPECGTQCKQRKLQMDDEIKMLRRDLKLVEEAKQLAEQHGRKWEQELRIFEAEIRNRDSNQPGTEMLMNALAVMQEKNCTLEKNLSAETRVKLDLFSALGDAKRQLEISDNRRRAKEEEVLDLRAKIAQFLAVMPTDSLCLPTCSSTGSNSMLRMNDTPPLQSGCQTGPASPMLSNLNSQQTSVSVTGGHQLSTRVVQSTADYVQQTQSDYVNSKQCGNVNVSVIGGASSANNANGSNLDPNASVYTPKIGNGPTNVGSVVVVGSASDA